MPFPAFWGVILRNSDYKISYKIHSIFFIVFLILIIRYFWKIREPSGNPVKLLVFILTIQKLGLFTNRWAYIGSSYNEKIKITQERTFSPNFPLRISTNKYVSVCLLIDYAWSTTNENAHKIQVTVYII